MILLLGGAGYSGKTLLAQKLLQTCAQPYLSLDHLKMSLIRTGEAGFHAEQSWETIGEALWPYLQGWIMTCLENRQHLTVEGSYLLPHKLVTLSRREDVRVQFIGLGQDYLRAHFGDGLLAYRDTIEQRLTSETRSWPEIWQEHREIKTECAKYGLPYFEIWEDYLAESELLLHKLTHDVLAMKGF